MRRLDGLSIFASVGVEESPVKGRGVRRGRVGSEASAGVGAEMEEGDVDMMDADAEEDGGVDADGEVLEDADDEQEDDVEVEEPTLPLRSPRKKPTPAASSSSSEHNPTMTTTKATPKAPLSPPPSTSPSSHTQPPANANAPDPSVFAAGGIPWYLAPFDPHGTTVHEERYTGTEVLRGMSEELSEVDEDTLGEWEIAGEMEAEAAGKGKGRGGNGGGNGKKGKAKKRAKGGMGWGRRRR